MNQRFIVRVLIWICVGLLWSQLFLVSGGSPHISKAIAAQVQENVQSQQAEADRLYEAGFANIAQQNYDLALRSLQLALPLYQKLGNRPREMSIIYNIGIIYQQQGQYPLALTTVQQAWSIATEIQDQDAEWRILTSLGEIYRSLGKYTQALSTHQQALERVRRLNQSSLEQYILNNLGLVYTALGQFEQALQSYEQILHLLENIPEALAAEERRENIRGQAAALNNIGEVYNSQQQYSQAIVYYQRALGLQRQTQNRNGEAETLNSLGFTYSAAGQASQAQPFLEQALKIFQELGDRNGAASTLDSLGAVYAQFQQWQEAWSAYQQSLTTLIDIKDRPGQWQVLSHVGDLLVQQNQPTFAIAFYKRSVNVTESIRQDLQGLPIEQRQSYTRTIAQTYRTLADLLLQQDRVLEAQQVLDLLKVQEIDNYLHRVRGNDRTSQGIPLLPGEENVLQQFLERVDITALIQQLHQNHTEQLTVLPDLAHWRDRLKQLNQNTALLYPLILEDRLELIVSTANAAPFHRSIPVTQVQLNKAIAEFQSALKDPDSDIQSNAQRLYNWLIRPLEAELAQAHIKTILYAPDNQLRYIPLAALHNGQQWLVEQFQINNITTLSLFDLPPVSQQHSPQNQPHVLAAAFSAGRHIFESGGSPYAFSGLPFTETEVKSLARLFLNTKLLLNQSFNRAAIDSSMNDYTLVHLATHAQFVTGQPEDSFIVLGDGDRITLPDMDHWKLPHVDLFSLSACQTGIGAILGNGEEILGFGYQIQKTGAKAAIASLWKVDDGGTEKLMTQFYTQLKRENTTKIAALRQAQINLIHSSQQDSQNDLSLDHPYYWAPFILIGNGL